MKNKHRLLKTGLITLSLPFIVGAALVAPTESELKVMHYLPIQSFQEAETVYKQIKDSNSIPILEEYVKAFPDSFYAKLIKLRLKELRARKAQEDNQDNRQNQANDNSSNQQSNDNSKDGEPIELERFGPWTVYKYYKANGVATCYIVNKPYHSDPSANNHGEVYFMLTRYEEKSGYEPSFTTGYNFKKSSSVTINVEGREFEMFTQDNGAWIEKLKDERDLVSRMRESDNMKISATTNRGTATQYSFTISQVRKALATIQNCT